MEEQQKWTHTLQKNHQEEPQKIGEKTARRIQKCKTVNLVTHLINWRDAQYEQKKSCDMSRADITEL